MENSAAMQTNNNDIFKYCLKTHPFTLPINNYQCCHLVTASFSDSAVIASFMSLTKGLHCYCCCCGYYYHCFVTRRGAKYCDPHLCIPLCPLAYIKNHVQTSQNFLYILPVIIARSSSDDNAMYYVLLHMDGSIIFARFCQCTTPSTVFSGL